MRKPALVAAFALAATGLSAEIAPDVLRTLTICATPNQSLDAVAAQLGSLGWLKVPPQDRARAGRALAPYQLVYVRGYGLLGDWDPINAEEQLIRLAEREAAEMVRELPYQVTLMRRTGEIAQFAARLDGETLDQCLLSLPGATADDVADLWPINLPRTPRPPLEYLSSTFSETPQPLGVDWLAFAPDAFAGGNPPPLVSVIVRNQDED